MTRLPMYFFTLAVLAGLPCLDAAGQTAPDLNAQRAWIEPLGQNSSSSISISVACGEAKPVDQPLVFTASLSSRMAINEALLRVQIYDPAGNMIEQIDMEVLLGPEKHEYQIVWDPRGAPAGEYKVDFLILRPPQIQVAYRPYVIKKACWGDIIATCSRGIAGLEELSKYEITSPYARMRFAIAGLVTARARESIDRSDWILSYRLAQYLCHADAAVRALMVFGNAAPELIEPVVMPGSGGLAIEDGIFVDNGRPTFLLGRNFGTDYDIDLSRLNDMGLSMATFKVGPAQTIAGPDIPAIVPPQFDRLFEQARAESLRVMVSLDQHDLPRWALDQWPYLADTGYYKTDITAPEARKIIEKHVRAVAPYLAKQGPLAGLDVSYEPLFKFSGEDIRKQFISYVTDKYKDRHSVNQAWRGLFADLDEIEIGWNDVNPRYQSSSAYQYDWQMFNQGLATAYMRELVYMIRDLDGGIPLAAALPGDFFKRGESRFGRNLEELLPLFDLNGCTVGASANSPVYALDYPGQSLLYTLLRSLAPGKPVVNFNDTLFTADNCDQSCSFDYVHSVIWDGAMSGLSASALGTADPVASPACLEGYATAALDLNRLSPVVATFQQAPALVHILWSEPSKIYENGDPFLQTALYAYEGCSFSGYKVNFISEREVVESNLKGVTVLVLPETPAVFDATFDVIKDYVGRGGVIIRPATPISFNEAGFTRRDVISNTRNTILVRRENLPGGYLSAMDAAITDYNVLPPVPRTVTDYGYPLEGVKSRYIGFGDQEYLYILNVRRESVAGYVTEGYTGGRDLIHGHDVTFPLNLDPLRPLLIKLNPKPAPTAPTPARPTH